MYPKQPCPICGNDARYENPAHSHKHIDCTTCGGDYLISEFGEKRVRAFPMHMKTDLQEQIRQLAKDRPDHIVVISREDGVKELQAVAELRSKWRL
jgi:hypothetical protein